MSSSASVPVPDGVAIVGMSRRAVPPEAGTGEADLAEVLAREALRDAGYEPEGGRLQEVGVVLGRCDFYRAWSRRGVGGAETDAATLPMLLHPVRSQSPSSPNGRVVEALGLGGPWYTVDADETAPLVALDAAVRELREHRADAMLVGSVQLAEAGEHGSPEAGGMLVLQRMDDAVRRGARVRAVVLTTGRVVNPALAGRTLRRKRLRALQALAEGSGVDLRSVDLIEVHGAGIRTEDADWWEALAVALGGRGDGCGAFRCVEPAQGHASPVAALMGMLRLVEALDERSLPLSEPRTGLPLLRSAEAATRGKGRPWPQPVGGLPRRALLIGQGCASTVQVIFEEAPGEGAGRSMASREEGTGAALASRAPLLSQSAAPEGVACSERVSTGDWALPVGDEVAGARLDILCGHQDLMQQFLASQASVFGHLAARSRVAGE